MAFTAPTLVTTISVTTYRTQLDQNFSDIQDALWDIQTELASTTSTTYEAHNMRWLDSNLFGDGVVGSDSFVPSFNTDEDALTISHPADVPSTCVVSNRAHVYTDAYSEDLADVLADDDTWHRVAVGIESQGAPNCSIVVTQSSGPTDDEDAGIDLLLWTFQGRRNGAAYDVKELRREARVLASAETFDDLFRFEHPVVLREAGALPAGGGALGAGAVAPWSCEVMGGHARLATGTTATDGVSIDVRAGATSLIAAEAAWAEGEAGTVKSLAANASPSQVAAGAWIHVEVTSTEDVSDASDLTVVLRLRKITQDVLS